MIAEGDVVTARPISPGTGSKASSQADPLFTHKPDAPKNKPDAPDAVQIRLVTAEIARMHAKKNPKDQTTSDAGVLAFDGEFVNRNTTLRSLEREASRVLGWGVSDTDEEMFDHEEEGACSCSVAQEIEQYGLSTNFHCRFTIDGSNCGNAKCPYSHTELMNSKSAAPPHCSICADALAFPCPTCLKRAETAGEDLSSVVFCPLVQNAGCGDLHHAHCLGPRKDNKPAGCPSGCPADRFPRESSALDMTAPHLILAWNGDRIDKIPISSSMGFFVDRGLIKLTTDSVISIVEDFLEQQQFALAGLSIRIHFRDAITETVQFSQSTLVSVCPSSSHLNQNYRRFPLFLTKPSKPPAQKSSSDLCVDFHTSHSPIVACGCTTIKELFPPAPTLESDSPATIVLYAVKRRSEPIDDNPAAGKRGTASKESMYLADAAWQPSVTQSDRGIAALLSSLYLLAHSAGQKGIGAEQKVLATAHAIFRFPPAVRALATLFLNRVPIAQEKAALSEALYHALIDFSCRAPPAIVNNTMRRFETVRIFLAHLAKAGEAVSTALVQRPVEEVSLICALSHKRLRYPVLFGSSVVERKLALLHQRGGELYRPESSATESSLAEIPMNDALLQIFSHCRDLTSTSTLIFRPDALGPAPTAFTTSLDTVGRDFVLAIRQANLTDLVSRGPLELKSVDVVAPQIVLDQEGLLAVFTGRGCGSARDVNFFRPTKGGDTEVDVNDVGHALEKVIVGRKLEDTWQVDSFGEVVSIVRPPDEAIVLCLDLSQSMNEKSGVSKSTGQATQRPPFNVMIEADKVVQGMVEKLNHPEILAKAKEYLTSQSNTCHHPWTTIIDHRGDGGADLLRRLSLIASRSLLQQSLNQNDNSTIAAQQLSAVLPMACFVSAASSMENKLLKFLNTLLETSDSDVIGLEPYQVPRKLLDFKTGDLLINPAHPKNTPHKTFVNATSKNWFETQSVCPLGHSIPMFKTAAQAKKAVENWMSGAEILLKHTDGPDSDIVITLQHLGHSTTWTLSPETPSRTLYSLANRATGAKYSSFNLLLSGSRTYIPNSTAAISTTPLSKGCLIEIWAHVPHRRGSREIDVITDEGQAPRKILVQTNASILALLSYIHCLGLGTSGWKLADFTLWHGLKDYGDGTKMGTIVDTDSLVGDYGYSGIISFQCMAWYWIRSGAERSREESRHLTRLHLLKELFNVFLNRAGSFDTTVSLVLGLVTFSDTASAELELTPVFENFRQRLDRVSATGNTAVYEALDTARRMLAEFRPADLKLRKRIIIVSDGEDTSSKTSALDVCRSLQKGRIIVDSVQVGTQSDPILHAISVATGGYRFAPKTSLADALSIFDLETMLFSGERVLRQPKPLVTSVQFRSYESFSLYPTDIITVDKFPPRAEHSKLKEPVIKSADISGKSIAGGDDRLKRIMREIKAVVTDPHPNIDVYVNHSDMSFLKLILQAPTDVANCPYKGGNFLLTCDLPAGYPRDPPEIRFVTFIMHPNVSKQGKVCIAELGRLWSSDITLRDIFSLIYGILLTPDLENPLEIQASLKYYDDDGTYALAVADAVAKHASKTRAEWQLELDAE